MTAPRRAFLNTAAIVLVADLVLVPLAVWLGPSWLFAIPIFVINWPAIPMGIIYSIFAPDDISNWAGIGLIASEILASCVVWGFIMATRMERKLALEPKSYGFPVIPLDKERVEAATKSPSDESSCE